MIPFNVPPYVGDELKYIEQAIGNRRISGDGEFTKKCNKWIEDKTGVTKALLNQCGESTKEVDAQRLGWDAAHVDENVGPLSALRLVAGDGIGEFHLQGVVVGVLFQFRHAVALGGQVGVVFHDALV